MCFDRHRQHCDLQDLHALAAALVEHETLTLDEIHAVLRGDFHRPPPSASNERTQPQNEGALEPLVEAAAAVSASVHLDSDAPVSDTD